MTKNGKRNAGCSARAVFFGAVIAGATSLLLLSPASAQISDSIKSVGQEIDTVPTLINYASYIMGTAMGVTGVLKLKAHVDNPSQNALYPGLGRLVAAALFVSLPFFLRIMQETTAVNTGGGAVYTVIPKITS